MHNATRPAEDGGIDMDTFSADAAKPIPFLYGLKTELLVRISQLDNFFSIFIILCYRRDCRKKLFSRHDPGALCSMKMGARGRFCARGAKLTKLMSVFNHWLVEFMRSFTSATSIHSTDQKVAGGAYAK